MASTTKFFIVLAVTLCLGCSYCCAADNAQQQQPTTTAPATAAKSIDDSNDQLDQAAIMQMCNESFRTSMGSYSTTLHSKQTQT